MTLRQTVFASAWAMCAFASSVQAQDGLAPLPSTPDSGLQRITPLDQDPKSTTILTTKATPDAAPTPKAETPAPQAPISTPPTPPPFARAPGTPQPSAITNLPIKSPFGHATPTGPEVPSAPHATVATPVVNVDAIETSEPAPPTPVAPGADPAAEDPAAPTEFSSPIFDNATDSGGLRKIVFRALNKVTAQSALFKAKPGEMIQFGRLQIVAEMCRVSAPNSQTDYAGLLDIKEQLPGKEGIKPLFRGWMYTSSPSITGLEHPVYDVTMVSCDIAESKPKDEPKPAKKPGATKKK